MTVKMRRRLFLVITVLLLIAAGCAAVFVLQKNAAVQTARAAVASPKPPVQPAEISLQGQIRARDLLRIKSPIEGRIAAFHAEIGSDVYEGQLLAEIVSEGLTTAQQAAVNELERSQE